LIIPPHAPTHTLTKPRLWGYGRGHATDNWGYDPMLTDRNIRAAQPAQRPYKLADQGGLFCLCTPGGSRLWRLKYRYQGREKALPLGAYPEVTLAEARRRQAEAKRALERGIDPGAERKAARLAPLDTFEAIARDWHARKAPLWTARHAGA